MGDKRAAPAVPDGKPHFHGHRDRLRGRLVKSGGDGLADYEMMELVLFLARPRGDMKPLPKRLIDHFGGFGEAISAPPERLREVDGVGEATIAALKIVEASAVRLSRSRVLNRPTLSSWTALLDYCHASMAYNATEQFRVLFLDRKNVLIADEVQQRGTVDHAPVYPREVVKRALDLGASAIILVHNHPFRPLLSIDFCGFQRRQPDLRYRIGTTKPKVSASFWGA